MKSSDLFLNTFCLFYKVKYQNFRLWRYKKGVLACVARRRREKITILEPLKRDFTRENGRFLVNFSEISKNPPPPCSSPNLRQGGGS